ncbi:MAG: hypothetical protein O3C63_06755 [Cyanobacteria bacterium]|nr:hypothetical protein [Cyanobacteriota bacterium]MDA1021283.1 hypothetical protein [Cyanobacteriota bacterium]
MLNKLFYISLCIVLSQGLANAKGNFLKSLPLISNQKRVKTQKPIYYELVLENMRPDADEFYVNSIFTIKGRPKATIARSVNKRAGDLYQNYVSFGIGDYIADNIKIIDIMPKLKELIVLDETRYEYYGLTMGYGTAVSRLIHKPGYTPTNPRNKKKFGKAREKPEELNENNPN